MKILVAGATGALGRELVPRLVERGHDVVGMTRAREKLERIRDLGAVAVVADALDPEAVARAVAETEPEVIVHQLTALSAGFGNRRLDEAMAETNRLRTEATDHLLAAGHAVGVRRFVAQGFVGSGLALARTGARVKDEGDPLDPSPPDGARRTIEALRYLEGAVTGATWTEGIVLRYGSFYGPGTAFAPGGEYHEMILRRKLPLVGSGAGVWSFVHVADAAEATVAAVERGRRGIYHVTDDDPAPVAEWLPAAAAEAGAKAPYRVPRWLGRLAAGEAVVALMTEGRGASNAKAKRDLGWSPAHPTWRGGLLGADT
jgi:nucleoside-diphosphate-sugar epimerase